MMRRGVDYHIHTKLCHHASGEMEAYVRNAAAEGLTEIGFTDHAPAIEGFDPGHRMMLSEFPGYVKAIQELNEKYTTISIRLGIEADIYSGFESFLEELLREFPIDYVIGSVHFVDGLSVHVEDHELCRDEKRRFVHRYFDLVETGVCSGLIDVVGHLDLVKWTFPDMKDEILDAGCNVLRAVRDEGVILEVNTSGWRKPPCEVYPSPGLLRAAYSLNIPVCIGSDAHRPEEVGVDFQSAMVLLKELGYCRENLCERNLRVLLPAMEEFGPVAGNSISSIGHAERGGHDTF